MAPRTVNLKKRNAALAGVWDEANMHTIKQSRFATHTVITNKGCETTTFALPDTPQLLARHSPQDSAPLLPESLQPNEAQSSKPEDDFPKKKTQVLHFAL